MNIPSLDNVDRLVEEFSDKVGASRKKNWRLPGSPHFDRDLFYYRWTIRSDSPLGSGSTVVKKVRETGLAGKTRAERFSAETGNESVLNK